MTSTKLHSSMKMVLISMTVNALLDLILLLISLRSEIPQLNTYFVEV